MSVTITNKAKRMQVFNLPHDATCSEEDGCNCDRIVVGVATHDPETGDRTVRALKRRVASSFTLVAAGHPGDSVKGLPNGVARLADVVAARKAGLIEVTLDGAEAPEKSAEATEAAPAPQNTNTSKKAAPAAGKE